MAVFFLPIKPAPLSEPEADGQKRKTLCDRACRAVAFAEAGASVVKYPIKDTLPYL
jgi:hypothetical protein